MTVGFWMKPAVGSIGRNGTRFRITARACILLSAGQSAAVVFVLSSATIGTISINFLNIKNPFIQISGKNDPACNGIVVPNFVYEIIGSVNRHLRSFMHRRIAPHALSALSRHPIGISIFLVIRLTGGSCSPMVLP
jgi:hypothetical protein